MAPGAQDDDPTPDPDEADPDEPDPDERTGGSPGRPGFDLSGLGLEGIDLSGLDLSGLVRMLQSSGPLNWQVAGELAELVATEGADEPPVEAATRQELEELAHAAQTHVVAETGLAATFAAPVQAIGRGEWASLHLDTLRPVLEALATTFGDAFRAGAPTELPPEALAEALGDADLPVDAGALAALVPMLAPLLLGVQAGSMVGYLARHALGRYDLPLPTADEPSLSFVVQNLDAFEADWSLERRDLRFYVTLHEVVHAAERSVPWVRRRLVDLAIDYVSAYEVDAAVLEARFGSIDLADPASMQALTEHPQEILGAMQSERQRSVLTQARTLHATLDGYADAVLERVGEPLIPTFGQIHEAMARHRIERGEAERFVEALLGIGGDRGDYERGAAFVRGVTERAGPAAIHRLWEHAAMEPTPAELDAPGLWLARIDLDTDDESAGGAGT